MNINKDMKKVLLFILITYLSNWIIFVFASTNELLLTLGVLMPSIIGILFMLFDKSRTEKSLRKRIISFKLIKFRWYLVIIFTIPAIFVLSQILLKSLGGAVTDIADVYKVFSNPALVFLIILYSGLGAGVGEEFGWRGFLLDILQKRFNAFVSSFIVGVVWAAWHIPIRISQNVNLFSADNIIDFIRIVLLSFFFTWIYNNNNRSILSAILTHCMINSSVYILSGYKHLSLEMSTLITLFMAVLVIFISVVYKPNTFTRNNTSTYKGGSANA